MQGKTILLIVGGGIAAYKALELIRLLRKAGASCRAILTKGGAQFITPLSLGALTGDKVYQDLFDLTDEAEMGHIQLSRRADLIVICPATADLLAKMAAGMADDLATTVLLATDKPVLAAPAMNVRMWNHAATRANVATLEARGIHILPPDSGEMACGEFGPGRLPEAEAIFAAIKTKLGTDAAPLKGRHIIVTAGPTHEPIDPVRYIANRSSGKQGFAIAQALAHLGARVSLVAGPVSCATPQGVTRIDVEQARDMLAAVEKALPADAAVMVAAVADWGTEARPQKIKKDGSGAPAPLALKENPDILATLCQHAQRPKLVVGFAAETENTLAHATEKRARKGCDWIVANDVSGDVMGGDHNRIHLITAQSAETWEKMPKAEVARLLALRISDALARN